MDGLPLVELKSRELNGGRVERLTSSHWKLNLQPGNEQNYCLAQLDDYLNLSRDRFLHRVPFSISLNARVSDREMPGTWGFGFWNDPFGMGLGITGWRPKLPVLPNAAWFFHSSKENYLSLKDDGFTKGMMSGIFCSPKVPATFTLAFAPFLPLMYFRPAAQWLRRLAYRIIKEDSKHLDLDWTTWHHFAIQANHGRIEFLLDNAVCFSSGLTPGGALGFVAWIDNQYFAFRPDGSVGYGVISLKVDSWLEICNLHVGN